jgi:hypothetical protein
MDFSLAGVFPQDQNDEMNPAQSITAESLQSLPRHARVHFVGWAVLMAAVALRRDEQRTQDLGALRRFVAAILHSAAGEPVDPDWERDLGKAQREIVLGTQPAPGPRPSRPGQPGHHTTGAVRMHVRAAIISAAELIRDPVSGVAFTPLKHCLGAFRSARTSDLEEQVASAFEEVRRRAADEEWTDTTPLPPGLLSEA